ncbi:MAG: IPT/TIG domain-containing protein [Betaproteobacteria bacterium]|nr:IPT/TIG domain-containing protein [Betaproteobacteria bacterium]
MEVVVIKKRIHWLLSLAFAVAAQSAQAYPSTSVSNTVDFTSDVIYQIVTDRFVDGNAANNPTGTAFSSGCTQLKLYCGGDWQGVINKLNDGYLTGMGITAIWISVPVENITAVLNYSGVNSTSYHGYWPRDMKKANLAFGSMTDFTNLVNTAHSKGIKVIIDFVPNHSSPADPAVPGFAENGTLYDNGAFFGAYSNDPNNRFHHYGGTDFSTIENGAYKNLFDLADLDQQNSAVDGYLKAAIKVWLDTGIDGIRVDAVKHMPFGWQKNWMQTIYSHRPVFTFGEWFLGAGEVDPANHTFANESGMSLLDFRFGQTVRQVFRDRSKTMTDLDAMLTGTATAYSEVIDQVTFIDNHDMDRFTQAGAPNRYTEQALALALTSRGVPAVYYGTEQYMVGNGDPNNRAKMASFNTTTTAYNTIKKLAALRKANPALAFGTTQERWINSDVYIFERKFNKNVVLVAINRSPSTAYSITGLFSNLPCAGASAKVYSDELTGILGGGSITQNCNTSVTNFTLGANVVGVWSFKDPDSSAVAIVPELGHVGPMQGIANQEITLSGAHFGSTAGSVSFGATVVSGANITMWEDTLIKVKVPAITAGKYDIKVNRGANSSTLYKNFEILTGPQVSVRFVVNNATTSPGENVYLIGSVQEIGKWLPVNAIGPSYNQIVYQYPTWYQDVSVPANTAISFKFIKKNYGAGNMSWESGTDHTFTTPASGTATVQVNLNGWNSPIPVQ